MSKKSFDSLEAARDQVKRFLDEYSDRIRKVSFSKANSDNTLRAQATPVNIAGEKKWQIETFSKDNKAFHENIAPENFSGAISDIAVKDYRSTNIIFADASAELMISSKGKAIFFIHGDPSAQQDTGARESGKKNYILDGKECADFLEPLGITDKYGRVFDKKQAKYRQINRFTELLDDVYEKLPAEGELTVCDLCCGKSYLTFAVYYYLTHVRKRKVAMFGVDLKSDVIGFCSQLKEKLGFDGLNFVCGDINKFETGREVDLVISLHACDTATDVVLAYAVNHKAKVILSTPCCHHEVFGQLKAIGQKEKTADTGPVSPDLSFLLKNSILKSKFTDALTDSMRCLMLEAKGYSTEAIELIDPEETPKNVMIRAIRTGRKNMKSLEAYRNAQNYFGLDTTLSKLLDSKE